MAASRTTAVLRRLPGVAGAGLAGWLVDVSVLWVGHTALGVPVPIAAAAGFLAAGVVNYALNRRVFTAAGSAGDGRLRRYGLLFAANLAVVSVAVPLLADVVHTHLRAVPAALVAAKIAVTGLLLPVNTVVYGAWVFRDRSAPRAVPAGAPPAVPGGPANPANPAARATPVGPASAAGPASPAGPAAERERTS